MENLIKCSKTLFDQDMYNKINKIKELKDEIKELQDEIKELKDELIIYGFSGTWREWNIRVRKTISNIKEYSIGLIREFFFTTDSCAKIDIPLDSANLEFFQDPGGIGSMLFNLTKNKKWSYKKGVYLIKNTWDKYDSMTNILEATGRFGNNTELLFNSILNTLDIETCIKDNLCELYSEMTLPCEKCEASCSYAHCDICGWEYDFDNEEWEYEDGTDRRGNI